MNLELNPDGLCLKPKQLLKVRGGIGHTIVCHSGFLWVTQHCDPRDIVLGAGEAFALDRNGLALVQALAPSAVSLVPASSGSAPRRRLPGPGARHQDSAANDKARAPMRSAQRAASW